MKDNNFKALQIKFDNSVEKLFKKTEINQSGMLSFNESLTEILNNEPDLTFEKYKKLYEDLYVSRND